MTRVAVLDDYQHRVHEFADWPSLGIGVAVSFFHEPLPEEELIDRLADFEVVVLMRERTALRATRPRAPAAAAPRGDDRYGQRLSRR